MYKFLIADDHDIIRQGLKKILAAEFPSADIQAVDDAESAIKKIIAEEWSVVICDLSMPGRSGMDVLEHVKNNCPRLPVLILSMHPEEQYAVRVLRSGAFGYVRKDVATEELVNAVHKVLQGRKYISPAVAEKIALGVAEDTGQQLHEHLSNREFDVFKMLAAGQSVSSISHQLFLSINTVSTYKTRIMQKLNLKTNAELTIYAMQNNLL